MIREILNSAFNFKEIKAMLKVKKEMLKYSPSKESLSELAQKESDLKFCYSALGKVSRSFAVVIQKLPDGLKDAVCVFYLVLRGLDTVEDDMSVANSKKLPLLKEFYKKCHSPEFKLKNIGDLKDYKDLLENFDKVTRIFLSLSDQNQKIISEITRKMGEGMAEFSEKEIISINDYDKYCYYVAGLVGIGLSNLFANSGYEDEKFKTIDDLSNSMGLFLQKTNIIRDYHEDLFSDRTFWPKEIWEKYENNLEDFAKKSDAKNITHCLNELVTDAIRHIPDCIKYMETIQNKYIFGFCAIPQMMAIATLAKIYNNNDVYKKNVKIKKGLGAILMTSVDSLKDVKNVFYKFLVEIIKKIPKDDVNANKTKEAIDEILKTLKS